MTNKILSDGFVRLIDVMGTDESVVQAARVSYGDGTKTVNDDRNLIRYLMRNKHTSPFEMTEMKFHVRVPIYIWRQWIRHRTANVNEYSQRYSLAISEMETTSSQDWRLQSENNKQGSSGYMNDRDGQYFSVKEKHFHRVSKELYEERIKNGIAREQARKDLPLSTYTEAYWKIDLHNLFHFLELRLHPHAQYEIREYATAISKYVEEKFPICWEAFFDYRLNNITLSLAEQEYIRTSGKTNELSKRELTELEEKIKKLGIEWMFTNVMY